MNHETTTSTLGSLLAELREESTTLLRQEIALAKAELNEKAAHVGKNTLELATGGALAYAGLIVLLIGVALLLTRVLVGVGVGPQMAIWLGPVIVGLIVAIIGASMAMKAKKAMSAEKLIPHETVESLKEDKRWIQRKLSHNT
jgi:xanthine/uracil permease